MNLVIDANIIIACFITKGKTAELLVNPTFNLYAPEFMAEEVHKYMDEISKKTNRSLESLSMVISEMFSVIKIIKKKDLSPYLEESNRVSPDINDVSYFASALKLNCPIWSNDKKIREQARVKVYSTEELIQLLE